MNWVKNKLVIGLVGALIVIILVFNIGSSSATVSIDEAKLSYDELLTKVEEQEKTLEDLEAAVEEKNSEISEKEKEVKAKLTEQDDKLKAKEKEVNEILTLLENKESLEKEVKDLENAVAKKSSEETSVQQKIDAKQKELEKIENAIVEKMDEPVTLSAGQFIVGTDFAPGRYKAVSNGGAGNFVVYDASGSLKVNSILGGSYGVAEYVFFSDIGDKVETTNPIKLIPVE